MKVIVIVISGHNWTELSTIIDRCISARNKGVIVDYIWEVDRLGMVHFTIFYPDPELKFAWECAA